MVTALLGLAVHQNRNRMTLRFKGNDPGVAAHRWEWSVKSAIRHR
jgi:hypothetical protein